MQYLNSMSETNMYIPSTNTGREGRRRGESGCGVGGCRSSDTLCHNSNCTSGQSAIEITII